MELMEQMGIELTPAAEEIGVHDTQLTACSDACFMTTRPGQTWWTPLFLKITSAATDETFESLPIPAGSHLNSLIGILTSTSSSPAL